MTRKTILSWTIAVIAIAIPSTIYTQAFAQETKPKVYKMTGVVKSVDAQGHKLTVQHGDIPGFMGAMTMPYKAGKAEDLKKVAPGDKIQADVVVTGAGTDLENIKVNGHADAGENKK